jgi:hypothetical protein
MSGRRSHPRFTVATPWDGAMRVLRDVVVDRIDGGELLAVSHSPGIVGEEMTLDLLGAGSTLALRVRVLESRPVIISGSVRHRIRLVLTCPIEEVLQDGPVADGHEPSAEAV